MNLSEALAHVDAMTPAEKAAWDKANEFWTDAQRDYRASQHLYGMADAIAPRPPVADDIDALIAAGNNAHNLAMTVDSTVFVLRVWPGSYDANFPANRDWLEEA